MANHTSGSQWLAGVLAGQQMILLSHGGEYCDALMLPDRHGGRPESGLAAINQTDHLGPQLDRALLAPTGERLVIGGKSIAEQAGASKWSLPAWSVVHLCGLGSSRLHACISWPQSCGFAGQQTTRMCDCPVNDRSTVPCQVQPGVHPGPWLDHGC